MTEPRIVLLGDSITVGCRETGVTAETTYPNCLNRLLARSGLDVELIVSALHGVYMGYAVRRFERMVGRHRPDFVLILLGANDAVPAGGQASTSVDDYHAALDTLIRQCVLIGATPIVTSPPPRSDEKCRLLLQGYATAARTLAVTSALPFVDLFTGLSDERFLSELLPDCQHPNPSANEIIAALVADCFLQVPGIGRRASTTTFSARTGQRILEPRLQADCNAADCRSPLGPSLQHASDREQGAG
ncbi:MAG: SGNH/GDSL hydrolase family protein [Planctomycetota bacterium]